MSWLDYLRASGLSPKTVKLRSYQIRRFAHRTQLDPGDVQHDDLIGYLADDDWSASMRHSVRDGLRSFYRWARHTGRVHDDPAASLPRVRVHPGKPRPAGELAVRTGMRATDPRVRLMVMLAAVQGLRCSEVARVHTDDVVADLVGHSLRVLGKGNKLRVIPLHEDVAAALGRVERGWVFPGQDDGHLSASYVSKLVSRALPEGITAHMLRHRFAGRAYVGSGHDIRAVQELLGHSSVATTQIYTPVEDASMRRGVIAAAS
ncbi:tyrosine-type recombinase/integrase [Mycetocola reblochoni]|uniref:tyrosine-type recombinase/integrase n=1 Tax=Mycetocola reblochoni TaxID=331618 RepID=UPI003F99E111